MRRPISLLAIWIGAVAAAPPTAPTVQLDSATVTGTTSGRTSQFLGIPFAQPPTGDLRFRLPQPNSPYSSNVDATKYGPSCPQQAPDIPILTGLVQDAADLVFHSIYAAVFPDDEDCLTVNVIKPTSVAPTSKLPVIAWLFGGGFGLGSSSFYPGSKIVEQSIDLGYPAIYVSMNYRLNAFGFLGGQEIKAAGVGNLGLQDQRQALRWIKKYIGAFGGDPAKVTIWGESAGAMSVALHMLTNGGNNEGLFRAGFMQSGSPIPVGDIINGQEYYDAIVSQTGCSRSADTLACLRTVPYSTLKAAMKRSPGVFAYQSLNVAWLPRADGVFLTDSPPRLVSQGSVANIPFITGDCDDEGTLFGLSSLNVTTDNQFRNYVQNTFLAGGPSSSDMDLLMSLYPSDITKGSPFGTGILNAITPQFKRIAALLGDGVFQGPRRYFLQQRSTKQPTWAYLNARGKALPVLGATHATDVVNAFGGGDMANYLIRFAANLDPNGGADISWPKYAVSSPKMLLLQDGLIPQAITYDTYRTDGINALTNYTLAHPL